MASSHASPLQASAPPSSASLVHSPLVWGIGATAGFYGLLAAEVIHHPLLEQHFKLEPIGIIATGLFLVGLCCLLHRGWNTWQQLQLLPQLQLPAPSTPADPPERAAALLAALDQIPKPRQSDCLVRRLRHGLAHVARCLSAVGLNEVLEHQARADARGAATLNAQVRNSIAGILVAGMLGAAVALTSVADVDASSDQFATSAATNIETETIDWHAALEPAVLALGLSLALIAVQAVVSRFDAHLLEAVDTRIAHELLGRFSTATISPVALSSGGSSADFRPLAENILAHNDRLLERQTQLWQSTIEAAHAHWNQLTKISEQQLEQSLASGLGKAFQTHLTQWSAAAQKAAQEFEQQNGRHWHELAQTMGEATRAVGEQQQRLGEQGKLLRDILQQTGQVTKLEDALNRNLATLAGAHHFEETLLNLSAVIHLLSGRLSATSAGSSDLPRSIAGSRAA